MNPFWRMIDYTGCSMQEAPSSCYYLTQQWMKVGFDWVGSFLDKIDVVIALMIVIMGLAQ